MVYNVYMKKDKNKIYIKNSYYQNKPFNVALLEYILNVIVYAFILIVASHVFNNYNIKIESFWYAILASVIINLFNITIKPFLVLITLPVTMYTLGFFYPVVNLIVLKLTSIVMGEHFIINGFFVPFLIVLFISALRMLLEAAIIKPIVERRN